MPRVTDPTVVRALLETDRGWAAYALGDLAPGYWEHSVWFRAADGTRSLALLYKAFAPPVLFTLGEPEGVRSLFDEMAAEPEFSLSVRPEVLRLLRTRYRVRSEKAMWRMLLDPDRFRPLPATDAVRLGPADLSAVRQLFADGEPEGEAPDFFHPAMLCDGVFFGVREDDALVALAGTHLVVPSEGVAAIGNVYTRRDRRGRGLAGRVTSAVAGELVRLKLATVALNVNQQNQAALRVYERLGFAPYCPFYEGLAAR